MKLGRTTPCLRIFDEAKAREFYLEFLGFTVDFEHRFADDFPLFMQIYRDGCVLQLSEHHGGACPGSAVSVQVDDVQSFQEELLDKNYNYARPGLEKQEWGTLDMTISDPFGNKLTFTQDLEKDA